MYEHGVGGHNSINVEWKWEFGKHNFSLFSIGFIVRVETLTIVGWMKFQHTTHHAILMFVQF